ncbi:MAG TPA: hypothetical protein VFJ18_12665 [Pararhizobium sp.]|nr:hypothetical protein [Pararhizobium sp.]
MMHIEPRLVGQMIIDQMFQPRTNLGLAFTVRMLPRPSAQMFKGRGKPGLHHPAPQNMAIMHYQP